MTTKNGIPLRSIFEVLIGLAALVGCTLPQGTPAPQPATLPPATQAPVEMTPTATSGLDAFLVENVDSILLNVMESFPVQVAAVISGNLPNGCAQIERSEQSREGSTIRILLWASQKEEAACTQVLTPFQETVSLRVLGLPAGDYTVEVGGKSAGFNLGVDNIGPGQTACPEPDEGTQVYTGEQYCFLYPSDFTVQPADQPGLLIVSGPRYGGSVEPVQATLTIESLDPAGKDLPAYVAGQVTAAGTGIEVVQENVSLGTQTEAIQVEGLPGRTGTRVLFAQHNTEIYVLTFTPREETMPEATADMERLFQNVVFSWTFIE